MFKGKAIKKKETPPNKKPRVYKEPKRKVRRTSRRGKRESKGMARAAVTFN